MQTLDQHLSKNRANLMVLILDAEGISCRVDRTAAGWTIMVACGDIEAARKSISTYDSENPSGRAHTDSQAPPLHNTVTGFYAAGVLAAVYAAVSRSVDSRLYLEAFGASASKIADGEYFRSVTALLLHADSAHLVANMAGILIFGTAVCSVGGWGLGWFLIVAAGAAGNLVNAGFYATGHLSIGASTAVFGAVGILTGYRILPGFPTPRKRLKAWVPLGAGLALLAFAGAGEHTDIMAHLFGFLAGLPLGLARPLYARHADRSGYQAGYLFLTIAIVVGAWLRGW
jgi:rhomboid protease GluP